MKSVPKGLYWPHGQIRCESRRSRGLPRLASRPARRPCLSGRRLVLHLPRLSRAAAAEPQVGRLAGQCRARLLQHAVEAAARHEAGGQADASRGHLRQIRAHLPQRDVRGLQGAPAACAGRPDPAVSADPRGDARLRHPVPRNARLRGRRPDRDLCAAGLRGEGERHHRVVRQGPDAARERLRRDVRHDEGQEDRHHGGVREVRRHARQGDRGAVADRGLDRQRAGRAGHRREDRRAADRRIRRSRNAARARFRDQAGKAPAGADRECRAGAHLEEARDARRQGEARCAAPRPRGA